MYKKLKKILVGATLFSLLPLGLSAYEAPRQDYYQNYQQTNKNMDYTPSYYPPAYPYTAPPPPSYPYTPGYPTYPTYPNYPSTVYPYNYLPNPNPFPGQRSAEDLFRQNQHPPR